MLCPCGSKKTYGQCCDAYISGSKSAATPEDLMRSRYTAYATQQIDYIEKTMIEKAAQQFDKQAVLAWLNQVRWLSLTIISSKAASTYGFVEFIARYLTDNKNCTIHELSEFKKIDGLWYYSDGKMVDSPLRELIKIGRNDLCPCGSKKKYKKCCEKHHLRS
jgi:SEC-C motif domain protein